MFVFLFFALFPMLDLMALALGVATISIAARQAASGAASSPDYVTAITAVNREATSVINSGFGKFVNLVPVGGYNNCGADLWIVQTNFRNNQIQYCGPNVGAPGPIDQSSFLYEYTAVCQYKVGPLCNLGSVPFIGGVPGLGQPATIKYVGTVAVEYPDGLAVAAAGPGPGVSGAFAFGASPGAGIGSGAGMGGGSKGGFGPGAWSASPPP